jgi:hypothetical protein
MRKGILAGAGHDESHRGRHRVKGAKDYILRLAPGRDENSSAIGIPLDAVPPGLDLSGRKRTVHPCGDQAIRHHGNLSPRNPSAAEGFGNGRAHGNDLGGDSP